MSQPRSGRKPRQLHDKGVALGEQLNQDEKKKFAKAPSKYKKKRNLNDVEEDAQGGDEAAHLTKKESSRILALAKDQLLSVEHGLRDDFELHHQAKHMKMTNKNKQLEEDDSSIEDEDGDFYDDEFEDEDGAFREEDFEITPEDEQTIAAFSKKNAIGGNSQTLGDIILGKLENQPSQQQPSGQDNKDRGQLHPDVVNVYTSVGGLLARYKSGKVPKAFKILPALLDWEQVIVLTKPEQWSPQAMYQATRLFASNSQPEMAAKFYSNFLLPAVRQDIAENKTLNYHHYQSIKKAIFKPKAFFRGFLFPLCEDDCNLREATIIGSVLSKVSIPVMHSGVALMIISKMPYSGSTSLFLRILINKKYSLPTQVIDQLQVHFLSFTNEQRELPVLWHQALLVFVQRYRVKLDKEKFKNLVKMQNHPKISPEIKRELLA
ncbi:hypothetical protein BASA81_001976 [Batrachochytrium salamandrivorans]|nr:hypothetical protein BASA81_001976 [Batrachochytrium salamandrivorans]